jgi:hypothetical protein
LTIPLSLSLAPELKDPIQITIRSNKPTFTAEPMQLAAGQKDTKLVVRIAADGAGEQELVIRATALQGGKWPVVSETTVLVDIRK